MSGGHFCECENKTLAAKVINWRVLQRQCNHSAFNGYHFTPSEWSSIVCLVCRHAWRTKSRYVSRLKDISIEERIRS